MDRDAGEGPDEYSNHAIGQRVFNALEAASRQYEQYLELRAITSSLEPHVQPCREDSSGNVLTLVIWK